MSYDYFLLFKKIIIEMGSAASFQDRMLNIISACEEQHPHPDWNQFKMIDFNQDARFLDNWLVIALSESSPTLNYKGLWFGLNNPIYSDAPTADIYVAASLEFKFNEMEWVCNSSFYPKQGPLRSKVLNDIYRTAYNSESGLANDAEYPLVIAYGAMASKTALERFKLLPPFNLLEGAAVGFDGGDLLFLGEFKNKEFICNIHSG